MKITQFQVQKKDLTQSRLVDVESPDIAEGEILVQVDRFAFTANNVSYGVVGERIGYWKFFPVSEEGWGIIPVWAMADVLESRHPDVPVGERLYGYFPMGSHLVITPDRINSHRLVDSVEHRAELPPVYNSYARVRAEPGYDASMDDERILLFPLYATSYCLYDFLIANDWFGATKANKGQVIIPSASSKTALGLAYALAGDEDAPQQIGVTSTGNLEAVLALGLYDQVVTYKDLASTDNSRPSVIVDMSGNGSVLSQLHKHLGEQMLYCSNVGLTHYEDNAMGPDFIKERSAMFFAPGHIQKRTTEWGPGIFEGKALSFWKDMSIKSRDWLSINSHDGADTIEAVYQAALAGKVPADQGVIVTL